MTDLFALRERYLENAIENTRLSNEMSKNFQTAIVTVVLAELAFLGTLGLDHDLKLISAVAATLLIFALATFLYGVGKYQTITQDAAKESLRLAKGVDKYIRENNTGKVNAVPNEFRGNEADEVRRINRATRLLKVSYMLIGIASLLVICLIWGLVL